MRLKNFGEILEIGYISPEDLKVAITNCRIIEISDKQKAEMDASIADKGVIEPIVVNSNYEIIKGKLRWSSALRTGEKSVIYIKMKFPDLFTEAAASIIDDTLSHPLHDRDRANFINICMSMGKSYSDIATMIGKDENTVRGWAKIEEMPSVINGDIDLEQKFVKLPFKKRNVVSTILEQDEYKDKAKAEEVINYALLAPNSDIEETKKLSQEGIIVNTAKRLKRLNNNVKTLHIKISNELYRAFTVKCKESKEDPMDVIEDLIYDYTKQ